MKSNKRNRKGISLIVLVITIIIMIILAGAIILSLNGSGIIGKANKAKEYNDMQAAKEIVTVSFAEWQLNKTKLVEENPEMNFETYAEEKLRNAGYKTEGNGGLKVNAESGINTIYVDARNEEVLIPEGFVASSVEGENLVEYGLVIYEGKEAVTEDNVEEARKTRNQFVWVPVDDINDFVRIDWGNTSYSGDDFKNNTKSYDLSIEAEKQEYEAVKSSIEKYHGFYIARYEAGLPKGRTYSTVKMDGTEKPVSKKYSNVWRCIPWDITYIVGQTTNPYGSWENNGAPKVARSMYNTNSIKSHLIYSEEWDLTLKFISERGIKDSDYLTDSTGKGHYCYNADGNLITEKEDTIQTGSVDAYSFNNIYDMAGNVHEWTMSIRYNPYVSNQKYRRQDRGGSYSEAGSKYPANIVDNATPNTGWGGYGFRVSLYLK